MSTSLEARPIVCADPALPRPDWITAEDLAAGFRAFTLGLGDFEDYQAQVDEILDEQSNTIDPELGNHGRRVGGYAGAIVRTAGGDLADDFHVGLARISGAIHDVGKQLTDRVVLFRSLGRAGFGEFIRERDMQAMYPHPTQGFEIIENQDLYLPPEAKVAAGCHHLIAAPGNQPYGVRWAEAIEAHRDDPHMLRWLHFLVKATNMADYYDAATTRTNAYFGSGETRDICIRQRAELLYGEQGSMVLRALVSEQRHYLLQEIPAAA